MYFAELMERLDAEQPNWEYALCDQVDLRDLALGRIVRSTLRARVLQNLHSVIRVTYLMAKEEK